VNLHTITEYQTLRKIEQLERISADGIVCCSNSDDNDIEFVNSRTYAHLLTLVSRGKLDWKSYTDPLLRVKATTAKAKETAAQIEKERKWLPDAAADAASTLLSLKKLQKRKQLVLVLHENCWQPALMSGLQHENQTATVMLLRNSRKKVRVDRGSIAAFRHGKLNRSANGDVVQRQVAKTGQCRCCMQFGRALRLSAKQQYCKVCKPRITAAPKALKQLLNPDQSLFHLHRSTEEERRIY